MSDRIERILSVALTLVAVAVAGVLVHREFFPSLPPSRRTDVKPPEFYPAWRDWVPTGVTIGDSAAPIVIVEFGDLECPFCADFDRRVRVVLAKYEPRVSLVYVHFPLRMHRFARPAARAAECAGAQAAFGRFVTSVYAKQDSMGLKPWTSYGVEAGVRDTARFSRCAAGSAAVPRIDSGLALGARMNVTATPTVIVNGWRFSVPPNDSVLKFTIDALLGGRQPFGQKK